MTTSPSQKKGSEKIIVVSTTPQQTAGTILTEEGKELEGDEIVLVADQDTKEPETIVKDTENENEKIILIVDKEAAPKEEKCAEPVVPAVEEPVKKVQKEAEEEAQIEEVVKAEDLQQKEKEAVSEAKRIILANYFICEPEQSKEIAAELVKESTSEEVQKQELVKAENPEISDEKSKRIRRISERYKKPAVTAAEEAEQIKQTTEEPVKKPTSEKLQEEELVKAENSEENSKAVSFVKEAEQSKEIAVEPVKEPTSEKVQKEELVKAENLEEKLKESVSVVEEAEQSKELAAEPVREPTSEKLQEEELVKAKNSEEELKRRFSEMTQHSKEPPSEKIHTEAKSSIRGPPTEISDESINWEFSDSMGRSQELMVEKEPVSFTEQMRSEPAPSKQEEKSLVENEADPVKSESTKENETSPATVKDTEQTESQTQIEKSKGIPFPSVAPDLEAGETNSSAPTLTEQNVKV